MLFDQAEMSIQVQGTISPINQGWGNAMKRNFESNFLASIGPTNQKFGEFLPGREPERHDTTRRSSDQEPVQQSRGIMMSGLLIFGLLALAVLAAPTASRAAEIAHGHIR